MIYSASNCLTSSLTKNQSVPLNRLLFMAIGLTFGSRLLNTV